MADALPDPGVDDAVVDQFAAVPDDPAVVWPYATPHHLDGFGAADDAVDDAVATSSAARPSDTVKDPAAVSGKLTRNAAAAAGVAACATATAQTTAAITTTSWQLSEIDKQCIYLKDDMPANVEMMKTQIYQVTPSSILSIQPSIPNSNHSRNCCGSTFMTSGLCSFPTNFL